MDEEQRTLRDLLGAAASEWRATFDAIDMPIFILGTGGRAERLNRAARQLAGADFRDLLGRRLEQMGQGRLWQTAGRVAEEAQRAGAAAAEVHDEATGRTWTLAASPGFPDLSQARPTILVIRDVTGLVELQESLRRSETMAAMGSLVAGVAHEVRNPLFGISATVDALERRVGERHELARHLGFLRHEVARLEKLMADLLDLSRPVRPEPRPAPLERVIEEALVACSARCAEKGVTVERGLSGDADRGRTLHLDTHRATQALVNVLENAIHHTPADGVITVATGTVQREGRCWREVVVRDSGPGFAPADLTRIFEPFFSRRAGGTGLGLPIVAQVVEKHGGRVEAGNAPQGGAEVRLRFPLPESGAGS